MRATRQKPTKPDLPELTIEQRNAIEILIGGVTDGETAQMVGVTRQTVWEWKLQPVFSAELERRRQETWGIYEQRLTGMVEKALAILAEDLDSGDPEIRRRAMLHVLKAVGLYGNPLKPTGETDPQKIKSNQVFQEMANSLLF